MTDHLARLLRASRNYGGVIALDSVDLDIPAGTLIGLLGPNGAGKTTLISMVTGTRRPTSGRVELFGGDPRDARNRIGLGTTVQQTGLPDTLRVGEVVDFVARHFPDPRPTAELLDRFGMTELTRRQTGALSGGQRRRLTVALAFVGRPRLVVLDEPTTGLDIDGRHALWDALREYHAEGGTLLLTSHYLEEIEALAERVVVLDQGRVVADEGITALRSRVATTRVRLRAAAIPELPGVLGSEQDGDQVSLFTQDADRLVRDLVHSGVDFRDLRIASTSLEEAFVALTRPAARTAATTGDAR